MDNQSVSSTLDDDKLLEDIGYMPSFKREFSNLATVSPIRTASDFFADTLYVASPRLVSRSASWVSARLLRRPSTLRFSSEALHL